MQGVTPTFEKKVYLVVELMDFSWYLNLSEADDVTRQKLYHVMAALALVEFPYYYMVPLSLEKAGDLVDKLNDINITRFMMQTLPRIDDVFYECFWQGHINNCSNMFFLQRTEAGFCYGFNSLAAENTRQCPAMSTYKVPTGATVNRDPCQMRRNIASGPTTGLEVFLKSLPEEESLGDGQRDRNGYRVFLQPVTEVPQAGTGLLLPPSDDHVMRVRLSVSFTESSLQVASLDVPQRSCLFPDEQRLELTNSYSQTSCLTDCRLSYIISKCNCSPYFFNHIQRDLRFVKPQGVAGDDSSKFLDGVLDCSHCLPTCRSYSYVQEVRYESITARTPFHGYIDVHYADVSAVKYGVDLAFDSMTLIVWFGGILSLFLGVSVLSCVELLYYAARLVDALLRRVLVQPAEAGLSKWRSSGLLERQVAAKQARLFY
ncbi:sodium channel protein Nach-like [Schistocerca piceifrons]|uniref:sodium channel protein Nach-like n=1 Tax=Schistocerca piceifrons TaxID=274613 RepID=UPI001F5FB501|nr:sodium channel protein Nach-like [Schistocerca piceifrons]